MKTMFVTSVRVWLVSAVCIWNFIEVEPVEILSITPEHHHTRIAPSSVTILCQADGPISRCQFRWRNEIRKRNGPLIDLSDGPESATNTSYLNRDVTGYAYSGEGLNKGECGITLSIKGAKQYTVTCRVRSAHSGWKYRLMSLCAENYEAIPLTVSPAQLVDPDSEVNILCKSEQKLRTCHFHLPGFGLAILDAGPKAPSPHTHRYYGDGLPSGDCGVTLNVKESTNGLLWCTVETKRSDFEWRVIPVIVKRPPDNISLHVVTDRFNTGANFEATCTVSGSRPASSITWYLGDRVLRQDDINDDINSTWTLPYNLQTLTQMLNATLLAEDHGLELRCEASHPALKEPLVARKSIYFGSQQCPMLESETVSFECEFEDKVVNCSDKLEIGTKANLTCKSSFTLKEDHGYSEIQCQQGGSWDKPLINCVPETHCSILESETVSIECIFEDKVMNCSDKLEAGTKAKFTCNPGFTLKEDPGHSEVQCLERGFWDKPIINCVPETLCPILESEAVSIECIFEDKVVNCSDKMKVGTKANLTCNPGFTLKEDPGYSEVQCQDRGFWDKPIINCVPEHQCLMLESETVSFECAFHDQIVNCSDMMEVGTKANLTCKPGFTLQEDPGYSDIQCQEEGSWDKQPFTCSPASPIVNNEVQV